MMKDILFLAHRIPYPPDRGDKIRSWNMLKFLAGLGRVHLACFADDANDAAYLDDVRAKLGGNLGETHVELRSTSQISAAVRALGSGSPVSVSLFASPGLGRFVSRLLEDERVGTVFAFSGQMAQFVPARLRQRFIMDFVDMDSAKYAAYARDGAGPMAWVHAREAEKLLAFERATALRADLSLFVSKAEADVFRARARLPDVDIRVIQNGIDLGFYDPAAHFPRLAPFPGPLIVFTGQMNYRPNIEAVLGFAREAFPAIRKACPGAVFAVVGRKPTDAVRQLQQRPGIVVTGAVDDVRSWLAAADVVVAPLRIARGVQNKVLEAMAMARPVVASPQAFEGIEAAAGRDLVVADGAAAEAAAVIGLLADRTRAAELGRAARARMARAYRWEARLAPLTRILGAPLREAAA
ncbi:MAG TPA: TIGR03087 family PEP-CTERM/XrtA system glycosyltransferase [Allosphingosinicella sp.]|nr:TIGR03087 family PEP-CTERM/XrtA system glycosyltransferase [Allosphingosinicella sp.]